MTGPRVTYDERDEQVLRPRPNSPHAHQRSPLNLACTVCAAKRKDPAMNHTNRTEPSR